MEAAHIVPVKDDRTAAGKAAAQLLSLYDLRNGITLCTHCHGMSSRAQTKYGL